MLQFCYRDTTRVRHFGTLRLRRVTFYGHSKLFVLLVLINTRDRRYDGVVKVFQVTGDGVVQLQRFEREHAVQDATAAAVVVAGRRVRSGRRRGGHR